MRKPFANHGRRLPKRETKDVTMPVAGESMTLSEREDPNAESHRCMKCRQVEFYRNVSTLDNAIRLWLCPPCQRELTELVRGWLGAPVKETVPAP